MSFRELKTYAFRCDKCGLYMPNQANADYDTRPEPPMGWEVWEYPKNSEWLAERGIYLARYRTNVCKDYCKNCSKSYPLNSPQNSWYGWSEHELRTTDVARGCRCFPAKKG